MLFIASLPLYFLPPIFSLSISLTCICISAMQTKVWSQVRQLYRLNLSLLFLKPKSISKFLPLVPPARHNSPLLYLTVAFHLSLTFTFPASPPPSLSLCLCFPLLNCFAVDLTAMINDLKASGKQTERDTTSSPFSYKPPVFLICQLLVCSH